MANELVLPPPRLVMTVRLRSGAIVRALLALVVIGAAAAAFFAYRRGDAAAEVKREIVAIVGEIGLPPDWRATAEQYVHAAHEKAFHKAMDVTRRLGEKFDAKVYYDEVFELIIAWAREDGKPDLAARLDDARKTYSLQVTEH